MPSAAELVGLWCVYRVVALSGDDLGGVWVPQHQIGVRAHGDAPFARVQVEDLGGVGAGHCNKLVFVHFARHLKGSTTVIVPLLYSLVASANISS